MPFPNDPCGITRFLQHLGKRRLILQPLSMFGMIGVGVNDCFILHAADIAL